MRVLIDTCIIIDALQNRKPFSYDAQKIFFAAANKRFTGFITAKAVTDIYYIPHRATHDDKETRKILNRLFYLFEVLDTTGMDCKKALASLISDYEDAVMNETALREDIDYFVTRNQKDYKHSDIPVVLPLQLLDILNNIAE